MKKYIFFDFFGVISSEIAPIWFRRHFTAAEADRIKSEIVAPADLGLVSEAEMFRQLSERMGIPAEQIANEWQDLIFINAPLVSFIQKLKEQYPVYLLSNAIAPFIRRILESHNLYGLFDSIFISSEMGCAKPDRAFFDIVLDTLNVSAEDAVFIDDNLSNIKGAALAGIDGILFSENQSFKLEFDKYFDTSEMELR